MLKHMEVDIVAVYYGMSIYHSLKISRYVWIVAVRRCPTIAQCQYPVTKTLRAACSVCVTGHVTAS